MPHARLHAVVLAALVALLVAVLPPTAGADRGRGDRVPAGLSQLAGQTSLRAALTRENFYFIMADRFANGDTANDQGGLTGSREVTGFDPTSKGWYHGGDLQGMISKLDYIKGLGTTAIWLTPSFKNKPVQGLGGPFPSAGYHGYWITDFTQIDPHLGTNADLEALIAGAHARGMKVFFDIITNHTADVIDYQQKQYAYLPKASHPYKDASGNPFDDRAFAGKDAFPSLDLQSFPYTPFVRDAEQDVKKPDWLNDVTLYHNRGDSTFSGESSTYGDFAGLDDLFTENPRVVEGMTEIYKSWVRFGVDGFRIDTMKHVNTEFWQRFLPAILDEAHRVGTKDFFAFGEVFDTASNPFLSRFTTTAKAQAVLDFTFQEQARQFAGRSAPTDQLRARFAKDDWFTDADSNAYQLPTFLGNHDMGHIGMFLRDDNPGAGEAELLARDRLAHELMYFSRGNPVVYFGDEQGFTGAGNDQSARQDMFPSQDPEYWNADGKNDDIGSDATPKDDNFDTGHPLYRKIAELAALTRRYPALRDGVQQTRVSSDQAGILAFSRTGRRERVEHLVVLNNSQSPKTASIPTYSRNQRFVRLYGEGADRVAAGGDRAVEVTVPALSTVVYRATSRVRRREGAPSLRLAAAPSVSGRPEILAQLGDDGLHDVSFAVRKAGERQWTPLGTDDNAPYRVFPDVSGYPAGTQLEFAAVVRGGDGDVSFDTAPATVAAVAGAGTAILHYHRADGSYDGWGLHLFGDAIADGIGAGDWCKPVGPTRFDDFGAVFEVPLRDDAAALNYIIHQPCGDSVPSTREPGGDRSFVPAESREVWVVAGDPAIRTTRPPAA